MREKNSGSNRRKKRKNQKKPKMRMLKRKRKEYGNKICIVSICLDASIKECRRRAENDSIDWSNVCNGNMWKSPILKAVGIATIPGNIVCDESRKIIARDLKADKLEEKIKETLK